MTFQERRIKPDCRIYELELQVARLEERVMGDNKALGVASNEINRRLQEMNEMRTQITAERGNYLGRDEYYAKHDMLNSQINSLQKFQWSITGALLSFQILIGVILHYWKG